MAIVADFMLVWLPAPTFSLNAAASTKKAGALAGLFAGCPDNAFQKVQPGMAPFSLGQRFGAVVRNGLKLFGVGLFASLLGVGVTNSLNVLALSAAYGVYMSSSSNLRLLWVDFLTLTGLQKLGTSDH
eukprot:scaffold26.g3358.t1